MESLFQGVHLDLDDDVFLYEVNTNDSLSYCQLHEVYKIRDEGDPIVRHIGNWSRGGRSDSSLNLMKEDKNFRRMDLRVSVFNSVITNMSEKRLSFRELH